MKPRKKIWVIKISTYQGTWHRRGRHWYPLLLASDHWPHLLLPVANAQLVAVDQPRVYDIPELLQPIKNVKYFRSTFSL